MRSWEISIFWKNRLIPNSRSLLFKKLCLNYFDLDWSQYVIRKKNISSSSIYKACSVVIFLTSRESNELWNLIMEIDDMGGICEILKRRLSVNCSIFLFFSFCCDVSALFKRGFRGAAHAALSLRLSVKKYQYAFIRTNKLSTVLLS